jgi:hypothetical protein
MIKPDDKGVRGRGQGPTLVYSLHGSPVSLHFMNSDSGQERPRFKTDHYICSVSLQYPFFTVEQIMYLTGSIGQGLKVGERLSMLTICLRLIKSRYCRD